jgi:hypothetical protein
MNCRDAIYIQIIYVVIESTGIDCFVLVAWAEFL